MPYLDFKSIKQRHSLEDGARLLNLKVTKSGNQFRGPCPACKSDDRALAITPQTGWYCHKAQTGGDVIAMVAHVLDLSMRDAAEWLQATVPQSRPDNPSPQPKAKETFNPVAFAAKLSYSEEVAALGFDEESAERFGVGFLRGKVYIPIRDDTGEIAGFIGYAEGELKLPPKWLPKSNVVALKRA